MKIVCAWCLRTLKEATGEPTPDGQDEPVFHSICWDCYEREVKPIKEREPQPLFPHQKPPPPHFDWIDFLQHQMIFSLTLSTILLLIVLAAEGLHRISGGKIPALIEWHSRKLHVEARPSIGDS